MTGSTYLFIILVILVAGYVLDSLSNILNLRALSETLPDEFKEIYPAEKYKTSQQYLFDNTRFGLIRGTISFGATVAVILLGGFELIDQFARSFGYGSIVTGLIFMAVLGLAAQLLSLPFSIYHTFGLEAKYGFNKTTPKTFVLDLLKGWVLAICIGTPVLALIFWIFESLGVWAWAWCWAALAVIQIGLMWAAPVLIMPLFNKYTPIEDGALKTAILNYAQQQSFKLKGIYTMDGSRRSTKANAFFTGFGASRRIVLFDTLVSQHSVQELVAILAHEMGHYKLRHIPKMIAVSLAASLLMFYILGLFMNNPGLYSAFKMSQVSVYGSFVFFAFLYAPIEELFGIITHAMSRRHEFEADAYAVKTTGAPDHLATALKQLSVENLSNLTPHPLKVWLSYSHPPILRRLSAIKQL